MPSETCARCAARDRATLERAVQAIQACDWCGVVDERHFATSCRGAFLDSRDAAEDRIRALADSPPPCTCAERDEVVRAARAWSLGPLNCSCGSSVGGECRQCRSLDASLSRAVAALEGAEQ